jgi:hypothetical protein
MASLHLKAGTRLGIIEILRATHILVGTRKIKTRSTQERTTQEREAILLINIY